jgi:hypothetical protein
VDDQVLELISEDLGLLVVDEVAILDAPIGDGVDHPIGHLPQRPLPLIGVRGSPEVLLGEDVRCIEAPPLGNLDIELLEGDRTVTVIGDPGVASLPDHLVVGVDAGGSEVAPDTDADALGGNGHAVDLFLSLLVVALLVVRRGGD